MRQNPRLRSAARRRRKKLSQAHRFDISRIRTRSARAKAGDRRRRRNILKVLDSCRPADRQTDVALGRAGKRRTAGVDQRDGRRPRTGGSGGRTSATTSAARTSTSHVRYPAVTVRTTTDGPTRRSRTAIDAENDRELNISGSLWPERLPDRLR